MACLAEGGTIYETFVRQQRFGGATRSSCCGGN
jgi:hypothetical protein